MFFKDAFYNNRWLWFHILAGGIIIKILLNWFSPFIAILILVIAAVSWETIEFIMTNVEKTYGNKKRFFFDALGDIFGALIMGIIIII